jgi:hypothetical protein
MRSDIRSAYTRRFGSMATQRSKHGCDARRQWPPTVPQFALARLYYFLITRRGLKQCYLRASTSVYQNKKRGRLQKRRPQELSFVRSKASRTSQNHGKEQYTTKHRRTQVYSSMRSVWNIGTIKMTCIVDFCAETTSKYQKCRLDAHERR